MTVLGWRLAVVAALVASCGGCAAEVETSERPEAVMDFSTLYSANCAACHGIDGRHGAAQPLNDPLYLALVSDARLQHVVANGVPGTPMLPFGQDAGGTLTADQVRVLVEQMRSRWGSPEAFAGVLLPAYSSDDARARGEAAGDPARGAVAQKTYCARCHGGDGAGGQSAGSIVDAAFLSLTSDQALRTIVIAGHAGDVAPAWRERARGGRSDGSNEARPMSAQEISDVVAWLASKRGHHD